MPQTEKPKQKPIGGAGNAGAPKPKEKDKKPKKPVK
jgi:hypothetical protein